MPLSIPLNVTEDEITLADVTRNDVSTTKHGFVPKAPNDSTKFLDGTGAWSVPASGSGSATPVFPGLIPLTGMKYVGATIALAVGDNDLYTAPLNKRALVLAYGINNETGSTATIHGCVKISGTTYRLGVNIAIATNTNTANTSFGYILEAGETFVVNSTLAGVLVTLHCVEYDATVRLYSPKLTTFTAGDNLLYTVPTGYSAVVLNQNLLDIVTSNFKLSNESGAVRTYHWVYTPSGGVAQNLTHAGTTIGDNTFASATAAITLNEGDQISVNVDAGTATQFAWFPVMEFANV